jgi:hypothetical protein
MQADKPSEIRFAQEGITLNILLVASLGASVLKIRFPTVGIIASQCGNKTFPRWEYIRCYSIAQADKPSEAINLLTY